MQQRYFILLNALAYEMEVGMYVLGSCVVFRIFCKGLSALVVYVERNARVRLETELS
jgi:hypothetical protein